MFGRFRGEAVGEHLGRDLGCHARTRITDHHRHRAVPFAHVDLDPGLGCAAHRVECVVHEIAHHGYLHERVDPDKPDAERESILRGLESFDKVIGQRPVGYRSPAGETTPTLIGLLHEHGILYDSYSGFTAGATYFYTDFTNKIANENTHRIINPETGRIRDPGGNCSAAVLNPGEYCLWRYFNIDGAIIQGVELAATWEATPDLMFRGTYTYTHSEQTSGEFEGEPLTRTPKHQASLRADSAPASDGERVPTMATVGPSGSSPQRKTREGG